MVLLNLPPAGLLLTWPSVEYGIWYAQSVEFMRSSDGESGGSPVKTTALNAAATAYRLRPVDLVLALGRTGDIIRQEAESRGSGAASHRAVGRHESAMQISGRKFHV